MCGLAGFVNEPSAVDEYVPLIRAMMTMIDHRGPEECGYCVEDRAALGLTRLAIIDVPFGKQPMVVGNERYWLVFNGTIVNFVELRRELESQGVVFFTNSDTEVLAQTVVNWGTDALRRLNGSFAFAMYDRLSGRLLLARDPIGERPLYYVLRGSGIAFCSEIKGLFALPGVPRRLSAIGLQQTFASWSPVDPQTCFEDVLSLPPGHFAVFEAGRLQVSQYWRLPYDPDGPPRPNASYGDEQEALREALAESLDLRLRSDFGVGVLLSGGIDSAVLAALAASRISEPLRTFSFTLPGSAIDESDAQKRVAELLGSRHSSVAITAEQTRDLFPRAVYHAETPLFRTSAVAVGLLARLVHDEGSRVVLFGPGSDELFCGYDTAREAAFVSRYDTFAGDRARTEWLTGLFQDSALTKSVDLQSILSYYRDSGGREALLGVHARRFEAQPRLRDLLRREAARGGDEDVLTLMGRAYSKLDPDLSRRGLVERSRAVDMLNLCSGWGLNAFADRVAVPEGVEFRAPFLDVNLIERFWSLPEDYTLLGGRANKRIVRDAFRDVFPADVMQRPKQGLRALDASVLLPSAADDWVGDVLERVFGGESEAICPDRAREVLAAMSDPRSKRDSIAKHAYCLLLSTALLEDQFVSRFVRPAQASDANLVKAIDQRGRVFSEF